MLEDEIKHDVSMIEQVAEEKLQEVQGIVADSVNDVVAEVDKAAVAVDIWFSVFLANSPVSQDVIVWNHLVKSKARLIELIKGVI